MDVNVRRSSRRTRVVVDSGMSLADDDSATVRTDEEMTPDPDHVKPLDMPRSVDHVVSPREDEEIDQLRDNFANMNPQSPLSPPNIDIHAGISGPLGAMVQRQSSRVVRSRVDPRCDPRSIPQADSHSRVYQPTDHSIGQSAVAGWSQYQPSGQSQITVAGLSQYQPSSQTTVAGLSQYQPSTQTTVAGLSQYQPSSQTTVAGLSQYQPSTQTTVAGLSQYQPSTQATVAGLSRSQASGVEVVPPSTSTRPRIDPQQILQLAANHQEDWKANLIHRLVRTYNKNRPLQVVSPDTDFESQFAQKKETPLQMKVVKPVEEDDVIILDSDTDTNFCEIRKDVKEQPQLKTLRCQPSDTSATQSCTLAIPPSDVTSFLRKHEFVKGHVLPGTQASLTHLLQVCCNSPQVLQLGTHGIVTTQNNKPTDLGEYDEVATGAGYQYIKDAGRGSYGCVKLYRDNTTNIQFVKKQILKVDGTFQMEAKLHSELHHINITEVYGFIVRDGKHEILMEYAGVSLIEYTMNPECEEDLLEDKIIDILYQGLSGLEYLDHKKIIHYDIKPENICVRKSGGRLFLKICDFGSAKEEKEPPDFRGCTVEYLSPELGIQLIMGKYQTHGLFGTDVANYVMTTKSDIFSLALTVMFIYRKGHVVISLFNNGKLTYQGLDVATINKTRQTILVYLAKNPSMVQNLIPDACCAEMKSILTDMVQEFPHNRPTATKLKDNIDDLLKKPKTPEVPVFLAMNTFRTEKRVNLTRQLSSRGASSQTVGYQGAIRQAFLNHRRMSRDQSSLPYAVGQRMDNMEVDAADELKDMVPKFSEFNGGS